MVSCSESGRHNFEVNDLVMFSEVEGMTEINGKISKILYKNSDHF